VFTKDVDRVLVSVCSEVEKRYNIRFLEIGTGSDHVHFLLQSVPTYNVTKIVRMIKSLIAREVFKECLEVKKQLWGGKFFGKGYFVNKWVSMELSIRFLNMSNLKEKNLSM
jgi:putative transposase